MARIYEADLEAIERYYRANGVKKYWLHGGKYNCLLANHLACSPYKLKRNRDWMLEILTEMQSLSVKAKFRRLQELHAKHYPKPGSCPRCDTITNKQNA